MCRCITVKIDPSIELTSVQKPEDILWFDRFEHDPLDDVSILMLISGDEHE